MSWDGTHEDAMRRCGFEMEIDGRQGHCYQRTRMKYPGNDPENGPAREYCPSGHSTCYVCGKWFQAINKTQGFTDEETGIVVPDGSYEADWCSACEVEHRLNFCSCGSEKKHMHTTIMPDDGDELSWACCGGVMCCVKGNE